MMAMAFFKSTGQITDANDAFLEMTGYTRQDVRRGVVTWAELMPRRHESAGRGSPDEVWRTGRRQACDCEFVRKDRSRITVLTGATLLEGRQDTAVAYAIDISRRKDAEKVLKESEQTIRMIFESVPYAVYECDLDGVITMANSAYSTITGYGNDELVGMCVWDMMEQGEQKESLPEYLRRLVAERPEPSPCTCRIVTRDGRTIDVEVNWNYKYNDRGEVSGFVCVLSDITERRRSKEIIRHERDRLTAILDSMQDGVYIVNRNWDIEYINPVLVREFGEAEGKKCYEYFHDRTEACPWCKNSEVFAGKTVRWQWTSTRNNKTYDLIDTPLHNADGSISKLEIFHDITELKKVQEEIETLARIPAENPNPVLRIRRDGTILYSNPAGAALEDAWGCRRGQRLEGRWRKLVEEALDLGTVRRGEINCRDSVFSLVFAPVVESGYVNIYGLDITDLRRTEEALYWESSVNRALAELSNILNKPDYSFEEVSGFILAHARRLTKSRTGFVGYVDQQTGYLVCPTMAKDVWKQCRVQGKDIVFKKFNGLWGWVLNERKSILTNSPAEDPRSAGTPQGHIPIERFIGAPAMMDDKVIGMIGVANPQTDYAGRDLWVVERLAEIYALAVQSNRSRQR